MTGQNDVVATVLIEDILGEFGFRIRWSYSTHTATAEVYEIVGRGVIQNDPLFHKKDSPTHPDNVMSIDDAEVYMNAFFKWDGCSDIDHGYHHQCDLEGIRKHAKLLGLLWAKAHQLIEASGCRA